MLGPLNENTTSRQSAVSMDRLISESCAMDCSNEGEERFLCDGYSDENIWELLPTPPRSPDRPCSDDELDLMSSLPFETMLDLVSDPLDTLELAVWGSLPSPTVGLKNDILHDCMWSGMCTYSCRRTHKTELTALTSSVSARNDPSGETVEQRLRPEPEVVTTRIAPSPALPVDPVTMMPYTPLSDHSYHNQHQQLTTTTCVQPRTPPVCDTPSDTEDEIDVVTLPATVSLTSSRSQLPDVKPIEVTATTKRRPGRPRTVPPLRVVIRTSNLVSQKHKDRRGHHSRKRFKKRIGSAKARVFKQTSDGGWTQRHYKRHFTHQKHEDRTESCSSDSEDCVEKRTMHNSMERKRRDDLRYAFQTLREHVPDLASNPKAPKVLILNKAASYARQLSQTGAALEKTLKQETRRRQELQRKLQQLSKMK